jgi:undecaprenyl-phosphate 4-deoxy-4-formamido-L-arabinose transferase
MKTPALSVVIPVYNEEDGLAALFARLYPALDALGIPHVTLARADELAFLTSRTLAQCYRTNLPAALILSPQLTGGKTDRIGARPTAGGTQ